MPVPALPIPHADQRKQRPFRRFYGDPLGVAMSGKVTIAAQRRLDHSASVMPALSTAVVELADGVLEVHLQPGYYKLTAELTSASGHTVTDTDTITVTG